MSPNSEYTKVPSGLPAVSLQRKPAKHDPRWVPCVDVPPTAEDYPLWLDLPTGAGSEAGGPEIRFYAEPAESHLEPHSIWMPGVCWINAEEADTPIEFRRVVPDRADFPLWAWDSYCRKWSFFGRYSSTFDDEDEPLRWHKDWTHWLPGGPNDKPAGAVQTTNEVPAQPKLPTIAELEDTSANRRWYRVPAGTVQKGDVVIASDSLFLAECSSGTPVWAGSWDTSAVYRPIEKRTPIAFADFPEHLRDEKLELFGPHWAWHSEKKEWQGGLGIFELRYYTPTYSHWYPRIQGESAPNIFIDDQTGSAPWTIDEPAQIETSTAGIPFLAPGYNPHNLTVSQVGEGYRLLDAGETLEQGDEYYAHAGGNVWEPSGLAGNKMGPDGALLTRHNVYRRKVPAIAPGFNPDKLTVERVGEGYRLLEKGEAIRSGDEYEVSGEWIESTSAGEKVGDEDSLYVASDSAYRRKVATAQQPQPEQPAPAPQSSPVFSPDGSEQIPSCPDELDTDSFRRNLPTQAQLDKHFEVVSSGKVQRGDVYKYGLGLEWAYGAIGKTAEALRHLGVTIYRRKQPADEPAPEHNPFGLTPDQVGIGYRLLRVGEIVQEGDEFYCGHKEGVWYPAHCTDLKVVSGHTGICWRRPAFPTIARILSEVFDKTGGATSSGCPAIGTADASSKPVVLTVPASTTVHPQSEQIAALQRKVSRQSKALAALQIIRDEKDAEIAKLRTQIERERNCYQADLDRLDHWRHIRVPENVTKEHNQLGKGSFVDEINFGLAVAGKALELEPKWHALFESVGNCSRGGPGTVERKVSEIWNELADTENRLENGEYAPPSCVPAKTEGGTK